MTLFARITLIAYFGIFCYCLGKFTYFGADGYGWFIPNVGGHYVSNLGDS